MALSKMKSGVPSWTESLVECCLSALPIRLDRYTDGVVKA